MARCQYIRRIPAMVDNLVNVYNRRTEADNLSGLLWYEEANRICREWSDNYGLPVATVAAVVAAISPQCNWTRNLVIADDVLADRAISIGGALHSNIAKARDIRERRLTDTREVFKSGPKVYNFSLNLAGDTSAVTVDTHACQAALDDVLVTVHLHAVPYAVFANAYTLAAQLLTLAPCDLQAIVWHTWKRENPPITKIQRRTQWCAMGEY